MQHFRLRGGFGFHRSILLLSVWSGGCGHIISSLRLSFCLSHSLSHEQCSVLFLFFFPPTQPAMTLNDLSLTQHLVN